MSGPVGTRFRSGSDLFLDANILCSAAWRKDSGLRRLWRLPQVRLVTSSYAAEEARRNLPSSGRHADLARLLGSVEILTERPGRFSPPPGWDLPDQDLPILAAATLARATHLLSGDISHFGRCFDRSAGGVLILPPAEYMRRRTE